MSDENSLVPESIPEPVPENNDDQSQIKDIEEQLNNPETIVFPPEINLNDDKSKARYIKSLQRRKAHLERMIEKHKVEKDVQENLSETQKLIQQKIFEFCDYAEQNLLKYSSDRTFSMFALQLVRRIDYHDKIKWLKKYFTENDVKGSINIALTNFKIDKSKLSANKKSTIRQYAELFHTVVEDKWYEK